jgi:hypothetical protein
LLFYFFGTFSRKQVMEGCLPLAGGAFLFLPRLPHAGTVGFAFEGSELLEEEGAEI